MHIRESWKSGSVHKIHSTASHLIFSRLYCKCCLPAFPSFQPAGQSKIYSMNFKMQEKLFQVLALSQTYIKQQDFLCAQVPHLNNRDKTVDYTSNICKGNRYLQQSNEELADGVSKTDTSEVPTANTRTNLLKGKKPEEQH